MNSVYFTKRMDWRNWLENNFQSASEIWLEYPKKKSGLPRLLYNDAVEEALCFGWIDSILRSKDECTSMQRFSPRKPKSSYSQANKERLKWLREQQMIHSTLTSHIEEVLAVRFEFPKQIIDQLKKDEKVWSNYINFPEPYKRIRLAYILAAEKRPDEFTKRLNNFMAKTADNKLIKGHGGIDKYYYL